VHVREGEAVSIVGFALTAFAAGTAGFLGCALLSSNEPSCAVCYGTGNFVSDEHGTYPVHRWCICSLGRTYQALQPPTDFQAAVQRLLEEETKGEM
jgi:hypothetical protein